MVKQYIYSGKFMLSWVSVSAIASADVLLQRFFGFLLKVIPVISHKNPQPNPCVYTGTQICADVC